MSKGHPGGYGETSKVAPFGETPLVVYRRDVRFGTPEGGNSDEFAPVTASGESLVHPSGLDGVTAVVLTFRRPRLATQVTRSLIEREGFPPGQVIVVVNGDGGLDDPELESVVTMVRLATNTGPAGGFHAGMKSAFADPTTRWVYLCEDDVGLFDLPTPRVVTLRERADRFQATLAASPGAGPATKLGAVVAYGRRFVGRGAHTLNVVPPPGAPEEFTPVDVACWGATLIARRVYDAGVLPDPVLFFGVEDFDFFCRVREAGFAVVVDGEAARAVADQQTLEGRDEAMNDQRPNDAVEAWRAYYHARNSVELIRRHGRASWYLWYGMFSLRHLQRARSAAERSAIVHGLADGVRGHLGMNPRYTRQVGEYPATGTDGGS